MAAYDSLNTTGIFATNAPFQVSIDFTHFRRDLARHFFYSVCAPRCPTYRSWLARKTYLPVTGWRMVMVKRPPERTPADAAAPLPPPPPARALIRLLRGPALHERRHTKRRAFVHQLRSA